MAVFLALAVGLLVGTATLDQQLVDQLEAQNRQAQARLQELQASLEEMERETQAVEDFADAVLPRLSTGRLLDVGAVLVAIEGVDDAAVSGARDALVLAGADLVTQLWVTGRMAAETEGDRSDLAEALGAEDAASTAALVEEAGLDLAGRLLEGAGRTEDDVLARLLSAGFVESRSPPIGEQELSRIGGRDQLIVVVGGSDGETALDPVAFLVPLAEQLALEGARVAAVEGAATASPFLAIVRDGSDELDDAALVTVDNLDRGLGRVAFVLAVEELLASGTGGHYGTDVGATSGRFPPV